MTPVGVLEIAATILLSLGGASAIVIGCASWLGKVWANRILQSDRRRYEEELERLRGDLNKALHVRRIQFETEFKVLSDIWAKLSTLRSAMGALRPRMDIVDPNETSEETFRRRRARFEEAFNAFVRAVDDQSPFYPEDIFRELSTALQTARRESISVALDEPEKKAEWYKEGAANFRAFRESADRISSLIRNWLASLQVQR
jgi:hypothetical protein